MDDLRAFLSKPIEEIEHEWIAKKQCRAELICNFVDDQMSGAGMRAANYIIDEMRKHS